MGSKPLESGEPCVRYDCALCCYNTRMPLTRLDINRIVKLGYKVNVFAEKTNCGWRLRNIDGKCFFLNGARCRIYEHRPYGCRVYPLVYSLRERKAVLDGFCPHKEEFKIRREDIKMLMFILRSLGETDMF
jgi:Fe-S-cluster containining protein